jgi:hypothetical protein
VIRFKHLIPEEDRSMFLFDRWLDETHSLSGRNDENKNLFLCPESGTGGSVPWPVLILAEDFTLDMWFYYFYTAVFVWVHFPMTYYIIIIIIIIIIAAVIAFVIFFLYVLPCFGS